MPSFVFFIYRFIFLPLAILALYTFRFVLGEKLKIIFKRQKSGTWTYQKNPDVQLKKPFWIHAASGEIEYARPLIRELKTKYPDTPVVVTYSSPSAERLLKNISEIDAWGIAPWDLFWQCREFIERINPRAVFFARTDVWPEMAYQLRKKQVPSLLFSATFAENSSRLKGLSKHLTSYALAQLSNIFVVSEEDSVVLRTAGINAAVQVVGDTRFDQIFYRLDHPQKVHDFLRPSVEKNVLVAGSTWPEDEEILLAWYANHQQDFKLLLAPHEISDHHLETIKTRLKNLKIDFEFYSQATSWTSPILILDQIGILAELYTWGTWAFVGGSFKKQVHSVMEPLAAGLPVWVGPFHHNNREALSFKQQKTSVPLVTEVTSTNDFEKAYSRLKTQLTTDLKSQIRQQVRQNTGATQKTLRWAESLVSK